MRAKLFYLPFQADSSPECPMCPYRFAMRTAVLALHSMMSLTRYPRFQHPSAPCMPQVMKAARYACTFFAASQASFQSPKGSI
jgi:hypothetical protein